MTRQEITEFYQEHHRRLYNISLRILRDPDEAEEVMQDTILKFVSSGASFSSDAQISAWLARTCIRASIDRLRRRQHRDAFLEDFGRDQGSDVIPSEVEESFSVEQIRSAMDALPEPYRLIVNLVLIEGLDYGEIAAMTDRKQTTLRSIYSRGLERLRKLLRS